MKPQPYKVLIVDDDIENLDATQGLLEHWGYSVKSASSGDAAISILKSGADEFALVLLDYRMPGKDGATTAKEIREFNQETVIAMYSCDDTREAAVLSLRAGAVDFIDKDDVVSLKGSIERACSKFEEARTLRPFLPIESTEKVIAAAGMVGCSASLAEVARQISVFKESAATILITGESGSGKELVAQALHSGKGRFVAVNCASFSKDNSSMLESELFGHEKGAFTGALTRKVGLLESALGGTVFLDEIHHMGLAAQAQLLRAVDEKRIRRVGGNDEYPISFRLVVATKPDIEARVKAGTFLEDLYFRVRFLRISVPALRERPEDIPALVAHFCQKHFEETGKKKTFQMRAVKMLQGHDWPGNVRDLQGYVKNLLTICPAAIIDSKHLNLEMFGKSAHRVDGLTYSELEAHQAAERRVFFQSAIKRTRSLAQAADRVGIPVTTFKEMIGRLGIQR